MKIKDLTSRIESVRRRHVRPSHIEMHPADIAEIEHELALSDMTVGYRSSAPPREPRMVMVFRGLPVYSSDEAPYGQPTIGALVMPADSSDIAPVYDSLDEATKQFAEGAEQVSEEAKHLADELERNSEDR